MEEVLVRFQLSPTTKPSIAALTLNLLGRALAAEGQELGLTPPPSLAAYLANDDCPLFQTGRRRKVADVREPVAEGPAAKPRRPHPLPPDWRPSQALCKRFEAKKVYAMGSFEHFSSWAWSEGALKSDWDQAFSHWVLKDMQRGHATPWDPMLAAEPECIVDDSPPATAEQMEELERKMVELMATHDRRAAELREAVKLRREEDKARAEEHWFKFGRAPARVERVPQTPEQDAQMKAIRINHYRAMLSRPKGDLITEDERQEFEKMLAGELASKTPDYETRAKSLRITQYRMELARDGLSEAERREIEKTIAAELSSQPS
jgi:hypothetical protein